jgi:L-alanine-DL-glutamate epimerase-like enolase superfamily enzyme
MKITEIEAIPFAIPFSKAVRFASGEVTVADHVLVRVHTDQGLTGTAEAPPRPYTYGETQSGIIGIIRDLFAPQLIGMSPFDREAVRARLDRTVGNPVAKAAIDIAVWDVIGLALGVSVTELLGGYSDSMRVAHMVGFADSTTMVDEALRMRHEHGVTTFKVKVGRHPIDRDIKLCRDLRQALGDDTELYIDGNRGWTAEESVRALRALADVNLSFAEELCPADDILGRRWLVENSNIPIYGDESVTRPADVTRELLSRSVTGVSIKTARSGFTGAQRIHHLCEGLGVGMVIGNQVDGQIGTLCSAAFGAAFEATSQRAGELSNFLDMEDDLISEPLTITNGTLKVRPGPGLGIEIDQDKLAHYRIDQ